MKATFKRKAIQYAGLRRLVAGLKQVASGAVVEKALGRIEKFINGSVKGQLARHVYTGQALATMKVELEPKAVAITLKRYRRYIKWSWRKGIPLSAIKRCQKIIREELDLAMKGGA